MEYTHVVWDFNGTILDDMQTGIDSINVLLTSRGLKPIENLAFYRSVFRFPIRDYYASLGLDFDKWPYADLAIEWVDEYKRRVVSAPLQEGILPILRLVKESGRKQIILSATEQEMLLWQIGLLGIGEYFDGVYGNDNIHAASKLGTARAFLEKEKPGQMLLIGDTDHDAQTASSIGADCVLLAIGHQSRAHLETCGVPVLDSPAELIRYLKG